MFIIRWEFRLIIQVAIIFVKAWFFLLFFILCDLNEWIVDNASLNKEGVLTNRACMIWAARADACDMCCSAPVISCFCPRHSQPASHPATSHPTSTSLLLGQRLSKRIILLFLTLLFFHPSVFLTQVLPSSARPSSSPVASAPGLRTLFLTLWHSWRWAAYSDATGRVH